jgi:DNA-directed RNA polymerase specialized sigma24 family protein
MLTDAEVTAFCEQSYRLVVHLARKRLGSCAPAEAEDIAQEALLALWVNRERAENALAYVGGVVANLVTKRIRFKYEESRGEAKQWDVDRRTPLDVVLEQEHDRLEEERRRRVLEQLREPQQREWARWVAAGYLTSTSAERCSNTRLRKSLAAAAGVAFSANVRIRYRGKLIAERRERSR